MIKVSKKDIYAAVLAGGKGERLWPKSRTGLPKQSLKLFGKEPIILNALLRAKKIAGRNTFIIASRDSFTHLKKELKGFEMRKIAIEPFGRNTAPAVGLAALLAFREDPDSILVVMPSDHLIKNDGKFFRIIDTAIREARKNDAIITLGVKPVSAESAYGYIGVSKGHPEISAGTSYKVTRFVEKPRPSMARRLVSDGRFFWNSGIFVFKTSAMLAILKRHMPALHKGLLSLPDIKARQKFDKGLKRLYSGLKGESLDYAVLEKSRDVRVVASGFAWNDAGSFNMIARLAQKDKDGNMAFGDYASMDAKRCVVFSDAGRIVGAIGVKDLIICATSDAVLVCDRGKAEDVKKLVAKIKMNKKFLKYL